MGGGGEEAENGTKEDVRHAASMQVSYEKRGVRLQRQPGEDASGSASDARAVLTFRSLPQMVCCNGGGYVIQLLLKSLRNRIQRPRLKPGSNSPHRDRITTKINHGDKSQELPGGVSTASLSTGRGLVFLRWIDLSTNMHSLVFTWSPADTVKRDIGDMCSSCVDHRSLRAAPSEPLTPSCRFKRAPSELDLFRHKRERRSLRCFRILVQPVSQFPGKLGWMSRLGRILTLC